MSIFPAKILLATDGSEEAALAAQSAIELAQKTNSELHVVHVGELLPTFFAQTEIEPAQLEREARKLLDEQLKSVEGAGGTVTEAHLRLGQADHEIVALAEQVGAGLVVMGSRGLGGMRRALMGSVSDSVVRHAHCPVLIARGEAVVLPTKILVATDGSEEATLAARTAADIAEKTGSELHVVHATGVPVYIDPGSEAWRVAHGEAEETVRREAQEVLDTQVEQIEAAGGKAAQRYVRLGRPVEEIVVLADEIGAGLVAVGSRGLGGIRRLLMGSVSDGVVRHAHCAVLVVRKERSDS